jgi:hypothetical protein
LQKKQDCYILAIIDLTIGDAVGNEKEKKTYRVASQPCTEIRKGIVLASGWQNNGPALMAQPAGASHAGRFHRYECSNM